MRYRIYEGAVGKFIFEANERDARDYRHLKEPIAELMTRAGARIIKDSSPNACEYFAFYESLEGVVYIQKGEEKTSPILTIDIFVSSTDAYRNTAQKILEGFVQPGREVSELLEKIKAEQKQIRDGDKASVL